MSTKIDGLRDIVSVPISEIKPYLSNPREHPEDQIEMIGASITRFGFNNPVLLSQDYTVIAGHGRIMAAKRLGLAIIPAIILPHLDVAGVRAYRLADNQIALKSRWEPTLYAQELQFVVDLGFAPLELGLEIAEIDIVLEATRKKVKKEEPVLEPVRTRPAITRIGDIWVIGRHRVICGSARDPQVFQQVMGPGKADAVISDMPWNLSVRNHISGKGKMPHPEFVEASGEQSDAEFLDLIAIVLTNQAAFSKPGALSFQFIDWRSVADMIHIGKDIYDALVNVCVWVKPSPGLGSLWRSRHEMICVFRTKGGKHRNNVQLGKFGRNRSNVWEYASPNAFGSERENLKLHPTCKNVEMIADAILDCTKRNDIVLDAFLGSGTLILAAHRVGRIGRGIELDPWYVDLAVQRIAKEAGETARLEDGRSFDEVAAERSDKEA